MATNERTVLRLTVVEGVRIKLDSDTCGKCQDLCYTAEVTGIDIAASGQNVCLLYRPHLRTMATAMNAVGSWLIGHGAALSEHEVRAWFLEHQTSLF